MKTAVDRILAYCSDLRSEAELAGNQLKFDACIRNFQILGESSAKVPKEIQSELSEIPWAEIKGMRNILVHEYFGVSSSVIWATVQKELPELQDALNRAIQRYDQPVHPWRICPPGEVYVRKADVESHLRKGSLVKEHLRRDHCRQINSNPGKDMLATQEARDIAALFFSELRGAPAPHELDYGAKGTEFDSLIRGWTRYWNEIFRPEPLLDADVVKALIATESGFDVNSNRKKRNAAKGLMQLLPATQRYLNGERKELKDHLFLFQGDEIFDPSLNIAAGVRWLFRKRETASARLKRKATWEETVEEYKDYLRRRIKNPRANHTGMKKFRRELERLKAYGAKK